MPFFPLDDVVLIPIRSRALVAVDVVPEEHRGEAIIGVDVIGGSGTFIFIDLIDSILGDGGFSMGLQIKVTHSYLQGKDTLTDTQTIDVDSVNSTDIEVPSGSVDFEYEIAIDVSQLKVLAFYSDHDITIKTNNSGAPDDTIILKANIPRTWTLQSGEDNPLTVDVVTFFLTMASIDECLLQVRFAY